LHYYFIGDTAFGDVISNTTQSSASGKPNSEFGVDCTAMALRVPALPSVQIWANLTLSRPTFESPVTARG
jgi:hypothetical protein